MFILEGAGSFFFAIIAMGLLPRYIDSNSGSGRSLLTSASRRDDQRYHVSFADTPLRTILGLSSRPFRANHSCSLYKSRVGATRGRLRQPFFTQALAKFEGTQCRSSCSVDRCREEGRFRSGCGQSGILRQRPRRRG
ncbi:uncharacterized protein BJX67DRAFT_307708 [Aspergillus lucknowensis]|uniref:Uncharacterized protein n=1 Tax=Aspergillus lucknowensis TaxID=176173 RepID=A0ABR4M040_9EURO